MFNVYFSATSIFLPEDKNDYKKIIDSIKKAKGKLVFNWINDPLSLNANELFEQATGDIRKSDFLVAEITNPSTGVGQQISLALSCKIPVIALIKKNTTSVSRFTLGTESPYLVIIEYDFNNLTSKLIKAFKELSKSKYIKFNFISSREIYDYLDKESKNQDISKSELLREIVGSWISKNKR